ncbi:NAD(P)-binding domain-containing protein [Paraburkholderia aspalathi]|nr:NAD(P)-binding domain-containing protein [Paraburkholderia aspalathi]
MIIGILGVGHLASTIIAGLLQSGIAPQNIILSPRGKGSELSALYGISVATDNASLVDHSDLVLLCVRPADAVMAVAGLPWRSEQILITACAGIAINCFTAAPARIVRAMPLTAAEINASPTACFPSIPEATAILERLGPVILLESEADFEVATVNAAVYGWVQDLIRQTIEWSVEKGLDEQAMRGLIAGTFVAAGRLINEKPEPIKQLLSELVTPGGITELGLEVLAAGGQSDVWHDACNAVLLRLTEKVIAD